MKPIRTIAALTLTGCLLSSYAIRADVRTDEKPGPSYLHAMSEASRSPAAFLAEQVVRPFRA